MNKLKKTLLAVLDVLKKYGVIIAVLAVGGVYGYIIYTSNSLASIEPDPAKVNEAHKPTKKPKVEDYVADKLHELEDSNVQFNSLLNEARENPFTE